MNHCTFLNGGNLHCTGKQPDALCLLTDVILNKMESNFNPGPVPKLYGNDCKIDNSG